MLPRPTLNSVKERGSNGALRSQLSTGYDLAFRFANTLETGPTSERSAVSKDPGRPGAEDAP
jgi:hypothetical protein